jgi:hypothetical protein
MLYNLANNLKLIMKKDRNIFKKWKVISKNFASKNLKKIS